MNKINYHETFTKFVTVDCGPPPVVVNEIVSYQTTILRGQGHSIAVMMVLSWRER